MKLSFDIQLQKGNFTLDAQGEIPEASITAIIGQSGAGKSSLLRCIAGLEPNLKGKIQVGHEVWLENGRSLDTHFRRIGFVFQHAALFEHLTVSQNLQYARKRALDSDQYTLPEIAQATRIEHLLDRSADSLSGGERQRVAIARAVASNPQLLLLDEPLSAVDEDARSQLSQELERIFRRFKLPALYVTHNQAEAARLSTHSLRMQAGRIIESGPTRDVLSAGPNSDTPFTIVALKARHDLPEEGLAELETDLGTLTVPGSSLPSQLPANLLVQARDIGLSLEPLPSTSFLNQLPASVKKLQDLPTCQVLVSLDCRQSTLYALVTKRSATHLKLQPGTPVHALIKSVTLEQ